MAEYIEREAAEQAIINTPLKFITMAGDYIHISQAIGILKCVKTVDAVPVVRCGECEYFAAKNSLETQGICRCGDKDMYYGSEFYPLRDDFCSYGVRKGENE